VSSLFSLYEYEHSVLIPGRTCRSSYPLPNRSPTPFLISSLSKTLAPPPPGLAQPPEFPSNTFPSPSRRHGLEFDKLVTRLNPSVPAKTVAPRTPRRSSPSTSSRSQQSEPQERRQVCRLAARSAPSLRFLHRHRRHRILQLDSRTRVSTTSNSCFS
jgi:hypothetical protein